LHNTDPMELDDLPLQVALLTGELADQRSRMTELVARLQRMADYLGVD
jgi:hypothetical protein